MNCNGIENIRFPSKLTSIGDYAFNSCGGLKSFVIPDGVTEIGEESFSYCGNLVIVTLPASLLGIEKNAFVGCDNLTDIYYNGTLAQWKAIQGYQQLDGVILHTLDYTITYENVPEGVENPNPTSAEMGKALILLPLSRTGYRFDGWFDADQGGNQVTAISEDNQQDVTLYAHWTANGYTVVFDPNGGEGSLKDLTAKYEDSLTLPKTGVSRTGYRFTGWNTEPDGSGLDYAPGQRVSGLTEEESVTLYAQWTPITYTVRFNANKGTGKMADQADFTYDKATALTQNMFTRTGYHFVGWNTKANGTGDAYADLAEVTNLTASNKATVTLYAQWEGNEYTLTFHHEEETKEQILHYGTAELLDKNTFTKPGYTFASWSTLETGRGKTYKDGAKVTNLGGGLENTDLYAQWTANKYTVVFHSNLEKDSTKKQTLTYDGKETALTANGFSWKGHTFLGWATSKDSGEVVYGNKEPVSNLTEELTIDLYAVWKANEYTVVFDPNGADMDATRQDMTYDVTDFLYTDLFDREGYEFTGWATSVKGRVVYKEGAEVRNLTDKDGAEVRLYAVWAPHSYTVTFDKNSDAATGSMKDQAMTVGKETALTGVGFKRANYTFIGWSTEEDGDVEYINKEKVMDLTAEQKGTVTLYAVWMPTPYAIAYQGLTAMEKDALDMPTYDVETTEVPGTPVRPGFAFGGWFLDAKLTREFKGFDGFTGTLKLYPKWEGAAVKYAVTYAPGAGDTTGTMARQTGLVSGKEYAPKSCSFKRPGYLFAGWELPNGKMITTRQKFSNLSANGEDVVLTAVWTPITYKVRFNANKGTGKMADQTGFVYDEAKALAANTFTRKGYTFTGWNTKANGSGEKFTDIAQVEKLTFSNNGTVTLYAQWQANTYTVRFDANGGEGAMTSLEMTYDQSQKLPANTFTNSALKFQGWATAKDHTKVSYKNSASVKNLAETGEITLYAVWKK